MGNATVFRNGTFKRLSLGPQDQSLRIGHILHGGKKLPFQGRVLSFQIEQRNVHDRG